MENTNPAVDGVNSQDLSNSQNSATTIVRDIDKEKKALSEYYDIHGQNPNFKDPKQKAEIYALAYPDGLPQGASDLDLNTYNSLLNKNGSSNMVGASSVSNSGQTVNNPLVNPGGISSNANLAQGYFNQYNDQMNQLGGQQGASNIMFKLQNIIGQKEGLLNPDGTANTNQNIGKSDIFNEAGLTGIGSLQSSLAAQGQNLYQTGQNINMALNRAQGILQTGLNSAKSLWDKGQFFYQLAADSDAKVKDAVVNSITSAIQNGDPIDDSTWALLPKEYQQFIPAWKALSQATRTRALELQIPTTGYVNPSDINTVKPNSGAGTSFTGGTVSIPQDIGTQKNQLAYRNNNPGNIRFANQAGAVAGDKGFAKFNSPEEGYQALLNQVDLDKSRDQTLAQFITKYAPPSENNTEAYIKYMESALRIDRSAKISTVDTNKIAQAIAKHESGTTISSTGTTGKTEGTKTNITALNGTPQGAKVQASDSYDKLQNGSIVLDALKKYNDELKQWGGELTGSKAAQLEADRQSLLDKIKQHGTGWDIGVGVASQKETGIESLINALPIVGKGGAKGQIKILDNAISGMQKQASKYDKNLSSQYSMYGWDNSDMRDNVMSSFNQTPTTQNTQNQSVVEKMTGKSQGKDNYGFIVGSNYIGKDGKSYTYIGNNQFK